MIRNVYPFGDGVTGKTYCGLTVITATSCFQTKSICTLQKTPNQLLGQIVQIIHTQYKIGKLGV